MKTRALLRDAPAVVTVTGGVQRLWSRWVSSAAALVAAALVASCGGGSEAGGGLGGRLSPTAVPVEASKSLGMKLLVISANGTQPTYPATTSILDQMGVPYDRIVLTGANATALQMVPGTLSDGAGNGKYQGILLETGDLAAFNPPTNNYPSAMTAAQWAMLRQYQFDFGVRSVTMYTRPAVTIDVNGAPLDLSYGLTPVSARSTNDFTTPADSPVTATFTATGVAVFSYLNAANPVIVKNAYTYLSTPVAGTQTVPLMMATEGPYAIASTYTGDGWENLAISADGNPELTHTLLLGYGVVNWVTKGVFLGERKMYLSAQPDDVMIPDDLWDPVSKTTPVDSPRFRHRNDATDYTSLAAWQTALQSHTQTAAIRLEIPFNGIGYNTTDSAYLNQGESTDSLSPAIRTNPDAFRWINHTWDHSSLNDADPSDPDFVALTVTSMKEKFQWNHEVATGVRSGAPNNLVAPKVTFGRYNKNAFIQPDISGLERPVFWQAAQEFGLQYILMDTSKAYSFFDPPRPAVADIPPNTGFYSSLDTYVPTNPRIFIIPRYPTNLYYNVSTPTEWVSEYNHFFGVNGIVPPPPGQTSWFGGDSTYAQILDRESEVLLRYMLKYNANSWMFHAANLRDYDGAGGTNRSLLADLLDAVTNKYKAMYTLPVLSPSQTEIGQIMQARMAYNAAIAGGLSARFVYGTTTTIELTNPSGVAVSVPVTGVDVNGTTYGGQTISTVSLAPGQSTTLGGETPPPPPQQSADLTTALQLPPNAPAGSVIRGTVTFTNSAAGATATTATGVAGTVALSSGDVRNFTVGSLAPGASSVRTFTTTVPVTVGTTALNATSTVTTTSAESNTANNSATASTVVQFADVTTVVTLPATARANRNFTVRVTFTNRATGAAATTATGVTGTVTLSNGVVRTYSLGSVAPGTSVARSFNVRAPSAIGSVVTATSNVATTSVESNTANNSATASTLIVR